MRKKKIKKFNPENRVCRANHGGGEANDQWRWGWRWVVPMIGLVAGDKCLGGLFEGEKG